MKNKTIGMGLWYRDGKIQWNYIWPTLRDVVVGCIIIFGSIFALAGGCFDIYDAIKGGG